MDIPKDYYDRRVVERMEVVSGPTGRRRWSSDAKARIVAESFAPCVSVSAVARRHGLRPAQLFAWRCQARHGRLMVTDGAAFAPVLISDARQVDEPSPCAEERVEIESGGVTVRLPGGTPAGRIGEIAAALRSVS